MPNYAVYGIYNMCSICKLKHPKNVLRCSDCGRILRTKPRHTTIKPQFVEY